MIIFRYTFTDRAGKVHRAPKGHPFAFEVSEDTEKTLSKKKES